VNPWGGLSTRFSALPHDWNIETRSFYFDKCFGHANCDRVNMYGKEHSAQCLSGKKYTSLQYGFIDGKKTRRNEGNEEQQCVRVNAVGLVDGTTYNLTLMTEQERKDMLAMNSATLKKDVSESYKQYEIHYEVQV
jgi:hypothetical protein